MINELKEKIHALAKEKGWYDNEVNFAQSIMLVVCELSEVIEEYRKGIDYNKIYYNIFKNKAKIDKNICYIKLSNKENKEMYTLIDKEDIYKLEDYNTFYASYDKKMKKYYAKVNYRKTTKSLHRIISLEPKGYMIDHINGDTLDNRKKNLRIVTCQENQFNLKKDCGACFLKDEKKWLSYIYINKKRITIGKYKTKEEALKNRKAKEKEIFIYKTNKQILTDIEGNKKCGLKFSPEGIPIELADAIIRILDLCGYYNIDIESAIEKKIEFNKTRPYRHGGKKI